MGTVQLTDGIIEKYLKDKLSHAIEDAEGPDQHPPGKLKMLKTFLQNNDQQKLTRARLYSLDNLLTEWQVQSKKDSKIPFRSQCLGCQFNGNFKKIMEDKPPRVLEGTPAAVGSQTQQEKPQRAGGSAAAGGALTRQGEPQMAQGTETASNEQPPQPSNRDQANAATEEAYRWSTRVAPGKVYGLDDKLKSLHRLLVPRADDAQFKTIGMVGMRGIGKTTLCQVIFNKLEVKAHYLPRIWVCMSKQPGDDADHRIEIVKRILRCLGVEDEVIESDECKKHGLKGLLFALRLQLVGKRYLIVLDDVWGTDEQYKNFCSSLDRELKCCEELAYGLPKGCGGAVIVTSRTEEVATAMVGEDNLHRLQPLSKEWCWEIFNDSFTEDGSQLPESLKILEAQIKEKCAGLPLAAKMMGHIACQSRKSS